MLSRQRTFGARSRVAAAATSLALWTSTAAATSAARRVASSTARVRCASAFSRRLARKIALGLFDIESAVFKGDSGAFLQCACKSTSVVILNELLNRRSYIVPNALHLAPLSKQTQQIRVVNRSRARLFYHKQRVGVGTLLVLLLGNRKCNLQLASIQFLVCFFCFLFFFVFFLFFFVFFLFFF